MATLEERLNQKRGVPLSARVAQKNPELDGWQKLARGAGNVVSGITQPFVSLAATPVQLVAKLAGAPDPYQSRPIPSFGEQNQVTPLTIKGKTGDILKAGATTAAVATLPTTIAGAVGVGAGIGAAEGAGGALQREEELGTVAKEGLTGGIIGGITGGVFSTAGKLVKKIGEGAYGSVIPKSIREAEMVQSYKAKNPLWKRVKDAIVGGGTPPPTTASKTAVNKAIIGTEEMVGIQARRAADNTWNKHIAPALNNTTETVNMPSFFDDLQKTIIKETPEPSRQKALLEALSAMKEDYAGKVNVSYAELQKFKEGWAEFVPDKAYRGLPIAGAFNDVRDSAAHMAREKIYKTLGKDVRQAYIDYGNLKALKALGAKSMTGAKLRGGTGGLVSAIKDMVLTPIATFGGQIVYRVGQVGEIVGPAGAKVLSDVVDTKTLETLFPETQPKE